jgi:hypothetical protein
MRPRALTGRRDRDRPSARPCRFAARPAPPELPPLLRRPGRLARRPLDAVGRPGLAGPHADQRPVLPRDRRCRPVDAGAHPRPLRRPYRRRPAEAPDADRRRIADGRAGDRPRDAHLHRRRRGLDDPRPGRSPGVRERRRDAGPAVVRRRDGRPRGRGQRDRPQLRDVQRGTRPGTRRGRRDDRHLRHLGRLLPQRDQLPRRDRRPPAHARGRAPLAAADPTSANGSCGCRLRR